MFGGSFFLRACGVQNRVITVSGAAQNNLRDVDVEIGPGLTAVVGVSGSGKSTLAFDTIYHEARRRFLETLSLGSPWHRMPPAHVRKVTGLASGSTPSIRSFRAG